MKDRIHPGDRALLWHGGKEAGIYAEAEITSSPYQRTEVGDWMLKRDGADAEPDMGVSYRLTRILDPPIAKALLQQHPVLKNMIILRARTGTKFAVTGCSSRTSRRTAPIPQPDYVEPRFDQMRAAIGAKGLRFIERRLRRYHLSLKTHGFVICLAA